MPKSVDLKKLAQEAVAAAKADIAAGRPKLLTNEAVGRSGPLDPKTGLVLVRPTEMRALYDQYVTAYNAEVRQELAAGKLTPFLYTSRVLTPCKVGERFSGKRVRVLTNDVPGFASVKGRYRVLPAEKKAGQLTIRVLDRETGESRELVTLAGTRARVTFAHDGKTLLVRDEAAKSYRSYDLVRGMYLQAFPDRDPMLGCK